MRIVDRYGNPFSNLSRSIKNYGRYGASYTRKPLSTWFTSCESADEDITRNFDTLRARSRDLFMGSPLATGAIKTLRTNIVGSGLALKCHIDGEFLGLSDEDARKWEKNTEREWSLWAETSACDASRMQTFYQLQSLALISALLSGDCFVGLPYISVPNNPYKLKIYLIESDRVCNPTTEALLNVYEGIELGDYGEPVAYYVAKYHPNSAYAAEGKIQEWKRVLAFGAKTGRRNLLHIMHDVERPGQRRGVPFLAPIIETLKQLERFTDAELTAAVISGLFTGFIVTDNADGIAGVDLREREDEEPAFGSGTMVHLKQGEDVRFGASGRPNSNFGSFIDAVCQQIGTALEIPQELLVKHFTTSYSASRAALLEAWKMFRMRRQWLIDTFCQPIYEEWLAEAINIGRIKAPKFFEDAAYKKAWSQAEWAGDAQGQLDPQKEANAAVIRVQNGFSTREREAAELTGMSFDLIASQLSREQQLMPAAITINQGDNTDLQEEKLNE